MVVRVTHPSCLRLLAAAAVLAALSFPGAPRLVAQAPPDSLEGPNAVLQPGDLVRLRIWREPDMSGEYRVDETGRAVFPRIGPVAVGRLTADSVRSLLVSIYSAQLRDPSIEVTLLRRVNVLGAVRNPGIFHVDPTMTVADVMALAGGVNSDGNANKVELIRAGRRVPVQLAQQSRVAESPIRSGDQLWVPERSWLSRNGGVVAGALTGVAVVTAAIISLSR